MKILFAGGGTMGSVSPLVAIYQEIKKDNPQSEFLFLGTKTGPEARALESYKINFKAISSGKLRRYFDWKNIVDIVKIIAGFFQSLMQILQFKPKIVIIAGAFVGVPVAVAAWLLRVPIIIHQQDILPGLANKLMAPFATKITVAFDISLKDFASSKTVLTGNPVRREFYHCDMNKSKEFFDLVGSMPLVLISGGGTGAIKINELVHKAAPELAKFCQIIHITGKGKKINFELTNYYQYEFLTSEMLEALCASDIVISRAGLSTLSELIIMAKPTILIPMPDTHQEFNAQYFQKSNAVVNLSQKSLTAEMLVSQIKEIIDNKNKMALLSGNISKMMARDGAKKITELAMEITK
ncbi:MAG: UDP-N-acetylglucosamine--N-acetylmuramyl-(pentapeptide) pyrophosphoryl-undecaprenol N-acetylglucosamine transferase [Candidatus Buchananbacteria bacterium]